MSPNPTPVTPGHDFELAEKLPSGRKARQVGTNLLAALEDAAKRGVAFSRTATPDEINELRRDLGSAAVRVKYEVTLGSEQVSETSHRLTFSAKHRANGQGSQVPAQAAAANGANV
jgi:hypothetical protein